MSNALLKNEIKDRLKKRSGDSQAIVAMVVIIALLAVMQIPLFVIAFLSVVGYFIYKGLVRSESGDVRRIFEFYLSAHEILRDDERRWFGFEIHETINRGEYILQMMPDAPPLVHFALGALYHKIGEFKESTEHLSRLLEDEQVNEQKMLTASEELREYVRLLREIERDPAKAPLTSAAFRALERSRRNRAERLLLESKNKYQEIQDRARIEKLVEETTEKPLLKTFDTAQLFGENPLPLASFQSPIVEKAESKNGAPDENLSKEEAPASVAEIEEVKSQLPVNPNGKKTSRKKEKNDPAIHKSITDVLREVYDDEKKNA